MGKDEGMGEERIERDTTAGETEEDSVPPVDHAAYKENCGGCHFAYQPALLPSGSWGRILESRGDHFGESIELSPSQAEEIAAYLKANAADRSDCETAREIMESLGSGTPFEGDGGAGDSRRAPQDIRRCIRASLHRYAVKLPRVPFGCG